MGPKRKLYDVDNMKLALDAVQRGVPVSAAAKEFEVPRTTLMRKKKGSPLDARSGPAPVFRPAEETVLAEWIIKSGKAGFPITKVQLFHSIRRVVQELKKKEPERQFPFTNDTPSRHWYEAFLKRHPEISIRTPQNLTQARASINREKLIQWHAEVSQYLTAENCMNVIEDAKRIFNADEAAFFLSPKGDKVLCGRGEKSVYNIVNTDEKECLSVLINCNAAGDIGPPLIVYQYERIPADIVKSVPDDWGIGKSDNGCMTAEVFFEYLTNLFHPWLIRHKIPLPVILFVDGHTSHQSLHTSNFCSENGIILVALYPNATHLIQPMDVAVFRTLKASWKEAVKSWRNEHSYIELKKKDFAPLLNKAINQTITPAILLNGFRKCGIYPWNINAVDFEKIPATDESTILNVSNESEVENNDEADKLLKHLEEEIGRETVINFEKCLGMKEEQFERCLNAKDIGLFTVWKNLKTKKETDGKKNEPNPAEQANMNLDHDLLMPSSSKDTVNSKMVRGGSTQIKNIVATPDNINKIITAPNSAINLVENLTDVPSAQKEKMKEICHDIENIVEDLEKSSMTEEDPQNVSVESEKTGRDIERCSTPPSQPSSTASSLVPSPFKKALFWPGPKQVKKSRKREKVPAVTSSKDYKSYVQRKEDKKEQAEKLKEEKKQQRLAKAAEKDSKNKSKEPPKKKPRKKLSSDSESSEEIDNDLMEIADSETTSPIVDSNVNFTESCYVIVDFESEFFPGIVLKKENDGATVKVMQVAGPEDWKWPEKEDKLFYPNEDILQVINAPTLKNTRGIYSVPEIQAYRKRQF